MTAAEEKFVHEYTRSLLVGWCHRCLYHGSLGLGWTGEHALYLKHAQEKGWVNKDGTKVLAAGFTAAAGMLKR